MCKGEQEQESKRVNVRATYKCANGGEAIDEFEARAASGRGASGCVCESDTDRDDKGEYKVLRTPRARLRGSESIHNMHTRR